jgi:hypothetical protein
MSNTWTINRLTLWQILWLCLSQFLIASFTSSSPASESAQSCFFSRNSRHFYLAQTIVFPSIPSRVMPKVGFVKPCFLQVTVLFDTESLSTISRAMEVIKFTFVCCYTYISFVDFVFLNAWCSTKASISCFTNTKRF